MAALPDTNYSTSSFTHRIAIFATTAATVITIFVHELYVSAQNYMRRMLEEPLLRVDWPKPRALPVALERLVARVCPPIVASEPDFVGGGTMFRRWR